MEYHGKLYGKLGPTQYFDTGKTSEDWDKLDMKIQQLEAVIRERDIKLSKTDSEVVGCLHEIADLKKLLAETATRTQLIFPTDTESLQWFDEGTNWVKSDFFIRLYEHFGVTSQCDKCGRALQGGLFCPECDLK